MNCDKKIIISTRAYNVEKYIEKTFESIINQTYQNWEWHVLENGSTDSTRKILQSLLDTYHDSRIVCYYNRFNDINFPELQDENNKGFDLENFKGQGYYYTNLDADDYFELDALETMIKPVIEHNVDIVITGRRGFMDDNPEINYCDIPPEGLYQDISQLSNCWISTYRCLRTIWGKLCTVDAYIRAECDLTELRNRTSITNGGDTIIILMLLANAESAYVSSRVTVNFCQRRESIFHTNVYPERYKAYKIIYELTMDLFQQWHNQNKENVEFAEGVLQASMFETVQAASKDYINSKNMELITNILKDEEIYGILLKNGLFYNLVYLIFGEIIKNKEVVAEEIQVQMLHRTVIKLVLAIEKYNEGMAYTALCLLVAGMLDHELKNPIIAEAVAMGHVKNFHSSFANELFVALSRTPEVLKHEHIGIIREKLIEGRWTNRQEQILVLNEVVLACVESSDLVKIQIALKELENIHPFGEVTLYGEIYCYILTNNLVEALYIATVVPKLYPDNALLIDTVYQLCIDLQQYSLAYEAYEAYLPYAQVDEMAYIRDEMERLHSLKKE